MHVLKKKSEHEISRITGLSRNTVSKWLHGEVDDPPKYRHAAHAAPRGHAQGVSRVTPGKGQA